MLKILHMLEDTLIKGLLVWITALVFFDVVLRFVFNTGYIWLQELTLYSSAWMVLLGASWAIRHGAHIGVSAVVARLPNHKQRWVACIAIGMCLIYCGLFFYGSIIYLQKLYMIDLEMEDLAFPKWIAMLALPLGFVMIAGRLMVLMWRIIQGKSVGFTFNDEAKDSMHKVEMQPHHRQQKNP